MCRSEILSAVIALITIAQIFGIDNVHCFVDFAAFRLEHRAEIDIPPRAVATELGTVTLTAPGRVGFTKGSVGGVGCCVCSRARARVCMCVHVCMFTLPLDRVFIEYSFRMTSLQQPPPSQSCRS